MNLISILAWINVSGSNKQISKICFFKIKICQRAFDGYKSKTTKNHEHARRKAYNPPFADVLVGKNVNVLHSREEFLSNSNNKQQLIKLLAKHFRVYIYFTMYSEILICKSPFMDRTWNLYLCLHSAILTVVMVKYKTSSVIFKACVRYFLSNFYFFTKR